ncbi:hypothetical protein KFE25_012473 [Diacronema lutheri]|uniref:Phospholipase C n=1 Tax=Diacronema lutheri TaxID=2081491 RepID=A0A8J6CCS7_DIALT|nr:hypothetical protein KFE25_012473 [Diacronema lutheri]
MAFLLLAAATPPRKVEHVVVLLMENRAFDHIFGCAWKELPGIDGLQRGHENWVDPSDHSKGKVRATCGSAPYVCKHDLDHSFGGTTIEIFGPNVTDGARPPYPPARMTGFANRSGAHALQAFSPAQLPVKMALAREFGVLNNMYASMPGPSQPNHMFAQSATACGVTETGVDFTQCGGKLPLFPQRTVYDALLEAGHEFALFTNGTAGEGSFGDVYLWGLLRHLPGRVHTYDAPTHGLFARAAAGTLPALSWVVPRGGGERPNDDHPCHDLALGEELLKSVYESVRAGPGWERTVLLVVYDDAGGFADHAPTPLYAPTPGSPCERSDGCPEPFRFDRLGMRLAALLISPLVPRGTIIRDPPGPAGTATRPFANSKYEHASIPATLKNLFGMPGFLTKRDAWAGSLHGELSLEAPRLDTPKHLPEPPAPAPAGVRTVHGCGDPARLTRRQRRHIALFARLLGEQPPRPDAMGAREGDQWLGARIRALLDGVRTGALGRLADEL